MLIYVNLHFLPPISVTLTFLPPILVTLTFLPPISVTLTFFHICQSAFFAPLYAHKEGYTLTFLLQWISVSCWTVSFWCNVFIHLVSKS
jgi:hypothetical protein